MARPLRNESERVVCDYCAGTGFVNGKIGHGRCPRCNRDDRPSYLRYCATCDHVEGDHSGTANMWGPRRGPCFHPGCRCDRFTKEDEKEC